MATYVTPLVIDMGSVGIRDLKTHTSRILSRVRDAGETLEITHRGKVIALLVPARPDRPVEDAAVVWADLDALAAALGLRGVGAVYVAVAHRLSLPPVTWDNGQRTRGARLIAARTL